MKKLIAIFFIVALSVFSVCFVLFRNPTCELEELAEKFDVCYNEIELITNKYNFENKFCITDEYKLLRKYYIVINDKSRIDVEFSTNATEAQKGYGTFSISYIISDVSDYNNFDVGLFSEIVNSISGKKVTNEFVTDFLTSEEEKYPSEKYGISGDGYVIEKIHALNFFEEWFIGYNLNYYNQAELWLYGYIIE